MSKRSRSPNPGRRLTSQEAQARWDAIIEIETLKRMAETVQRGSPNPRLRAELKTMIQDQKKILSKTWKEYQFLCFLKILTF